MSVPIEWSDKTLSYNAVCPACGKCVFMVTAEAIKVGPRRPSGSSLLLPVTMAVPHACGPHELLTNHNGDPQCLCGYMSPPAAGVSAAAANVSKHVSEAARG